MMKKVVILFWALVMPTLFFAAQARPMTGKTVDSVKEVQQQAGVRCKLRGDISTISNVRLVLRGKTGTLTYTMNGKRVVSNIVVDFKASDIDKDGFGHLVLKSYTPGGKLKGRFIGEMDVAECGYLYQGKFVNVNGGSTTFFLPEDIGHAY